MKQSFIANKKENTDSFCYEIESSIEFEVINIGNGEYIVMDEEEHNLYRTEANSYEEAIKHYLDWFYEMVPLCKYDALEGGYCESDEYVTASSQYEIERDWHGNWQMIEGR